MMRRNHHAHRPEHPPLLESDDDQEDDDNVDDRFGLLDTVRLFDGNDNEERNSSGHSSSTTTNGDEEALHGHWKVEPFPIVMRDPSKSPLTTPQRRRAAKGHHRGTEHTLPNSGGGSLGLRIRRILRSSTASSSLAILLALGGGAFLASVLILSSALVGVPSRGLVVDPIAAASRVVVVVIPRPPTSSSTTTVNRRKVQLPRRKLKPKKVLSSGGGTGYDTADYGGLYIDVFEEDGAARAIYHDFSLDETKAERHPRDPEEETVDAYYAYDDDARRNPYRYQPKHSGKRCRRTKLHRRSPLNCNSVYELDLFSALRKVGRSQYVGAGSYRSVFVFEPDGSNETYVYKTSGVSANYRYDDYEFIRMDCLVLELLSSSPNIVNSYGYCGLDQIGEAMVNGNFEDVAVPHEGRTTVKLRDATHLDPRNSLTPTQKLQYALEQTEPLALLHGFPGGVLVHDDLQLPQYLVTSDGHLKLNDFNRAEFMLWNDQDREYCKYKNNPGHGDWRAPEEYFDDPLDEKIDIFSLGNNLYATLTGLYPFYNILESKKITDNVKRGVMPYIDPRWSKHSYAESKIVELIKRCWKFKPEDRIDVFEAVRFLRDAVTENAKRTNGTV